MFLSIGCILRMKKRMRFEELVNALVTHKEAYEKYYCWHPNATIPKFRITGEEYSTLLNNTMFSAQGEATYMGVELEVI